MHLRPTTQSISGLFLIALLCTQGSSAAPLVRIRQLEPVQASEIEILQSLRSGFTVLQAVATYSLAIQLQLSDPSLINSSLPIQQALDSTCALHQQNTSLGDILQHHEWSTDTEIVTTQVLMENNLVDSCQWTTTVLQESAQSVSFNCTHEKLSGVCDDWETILLCKTLDERITAYIAAVNELEMSNTAAPTLSEWIEMNIPKNIPTDALEIFANVFDGCETDGS